MMQKKFPADPEREASAAPMQKHREANGIEKQLQVDARKTAIQRWSKNKAGGNKKKTK
jgi:hypothetical protein